MRDFFSTEKKQSSTLYLMGIIGEVGFLIALPLVFLALCGRLLDTALRTSPLFFLLGILLAIVASTVIIYRKMTLLIQQTEESQIKKSENSQNSKLPSTRQN